MKKLTSIALNETSFNVALLHQILAAVDSGVAQQEVIQRFAGPETKGRVRALQAHLGVAFDDRHLVDPPTALVLERLLKERGLAETTRAFTVAGTVQRSDGTLGRQQRLLAFDLDLRAAGIYRTVTSLDELEKNGGLEFLGEAAADSDGRYSITFYDWQYRRAERKKADVVVFAVTETKNGLQIVGLSRMVAAHDYSESGRAEGVDVILSTLDERTEYDRLMESLRPFLKESEVELAEIAGSEDQRAFVASELDLEPAHVSLAAAAQILAAGYQDKSWQVHEALYGIGRQDIELTWLSLYRKCEDELLAAIEASAQAHIIKAIDHELALHLAKTLRHQAGEQLVPPETSGPDDPDGEGILPERAQRLALLDAVATFRGKDSQEFWDKHLREQPEFKDKPELVSRLLFAQQLSAITVGFEPLAKHLASREEASAEALLEIDHNEWLELVSKTGVPDFVSGANSEERAQVYTDMVQSALNAAFPTKRLAILAKNNALPFESDQIAKNVTAFLNSTPRFDVARSRVDDFEQDISAVAGAHGTTVKAEIKKLQRVFQVSPTPEAMVKLLELKLHSATAIVEIPRNVFLQTYGQAFGGEAAAFVVYQRAEHIARKAELSFMYLLDYAQRDAPAFVMGKHGQAESLAVMKKQLPNYAEFFGSPDLCECEHCRSVLSPAAYFVELLRFLRRGKKNVDGKSPLDMLELRRPDLRHLPLTCENSNTLIPYIDLATEVMEHYAAHDSLARFQGHDTAGASSEELRANAQNVVVQAYRTLSTAKYPFDLPYHQPLDAMRTYGDHLGVSRAEVMRALALSLDALAKRAMAAEALQISAEEFAILTGEAFDATAQTAPVHDYFGYATPAELEQMSGAREFLARSGLSYPELVELIKTRFINPHQGTLDFVDRLLASSPVKPSVLYAKFGQINAGTLTPEADTDIVAMLDAHNAAPGASLTAADLGTWLKQHFDGLRTVITLYQPNSSCDLDTTRLRTLASIYEGSSTSGLTDPDWSRLHRFIRLQRRLGWSLHETDLMLTALGQTDITPETLERLATVLALKSATRLAPEQLAVLWGAIDSYGEKSLYARLFLNKAVQQLDAAFRPNAQGEYLTASGETLGAHRSAIQAAFRIREADLEAIIRVARVLDTDGSRALDLARDVLNLGNLSVIYRHVVLSKALKISPTELATLIELYGVTMAPFSTWNSEQETFGSIDPVATQDLFEFAASVRKAGFKTPALEYVLKGTVAPGSTLGLDRGKALKTAKAIRQAFAAIEQAHPEVPPSPITPELLTEKLALTFAPETVARLLGIVQNTASFEELTDKNLSITLPEALAGKYTYIKGSGRLTGIGIMTDDERAILEGLADATDEFRKAVEELYAAPERFIKAQLGGVFDDLAHAKETLLDRPKQTTAATPEQRLAFVYRQFVPFLKRTLRADAIVQHIASLIGLDSTTTAVLIAPHMDRIAADLAQEGFTTSYFSDAEWKTSLPPQQVDPTIDTARNLAVPPPGTSSVRWQAYIAPPASDEYTVVVDNLESDAVFRLYLDDVLVLEKASGDPRTSTEAVLNLNAAHLHVLRLDHAKATRDLGVRLQWKRATTGFEVMPATVAYPGAILDAFVTQVRLWHRAAKFIATFKLSAAEVRHFVTFSADFAGIDLTALTFEHWKRVRDYTLLRAAVPQTQATLLDVFAAANAAHSAPVDEALLDLLHRATAWNAADLLYLVATHFKWGASDFKNEIALRRLQSVMAIIAKTGLAATTVTRWGALDTGFDSLHATAQMMKHAVKAKYEEREWLDVAGSLSDKIRENQKAALISYLLTRPAIQEWGATDADGLFEYFLIDVQMGACMDTSRVVQASAAVQMFVSRCLLNLESDTVAGREKGVAPDAIDQKRWEWMKNYRVWQANREVFLYPENWLAPEWRMDRSELFKELESSLVQNDITDRSVEQAFRAYLASLAEIGNLEMCGLHQEYHDDGRPKLLHVFGRTRHAPYAFYYRTWNEYRKWSAWQKLPVSIRVIENGAHSGVHLIPVVWKKRLFLFWPEFNPQQEKSSAATDTQTVEQVGKEKTLSSMAPRSYWDIKLAWSECVDGKWTSKQVSSESLKLSSDNDQHLYSASQVRWAFEIDAQQQLRIIVRAALHSSPPAEIELGRFSLSDITTTITATSLTDTSSTATSSVRVRFIRTVRKGDWEEYAPSFQSYSRTGILCIAKTDYLLEHVSHKVLAEPFNEKFSGRKSVIVNRDVLRWRDTPFIFHDRSRSYFARPITTLRLIDRLKAPTIQLPIGGVLARVIGIDLSARNFPDLQMKTAEAAPTVSSTKTWEENVLMASKTMNKATISQAVHAFGGGPAATAHLAMEREFQREPWIYFLWNMTSLEFHTLHHPYVGEYVKRLNETGLSGLMESDTVLRSDGGSTFENLYKPNFAGGYVQKPADFPERTYYKDNVCFDVYGANSLYNWELFFHAPLYIATRLSRNGRYREAMKWFHYIFDPTSDAVPEPGEPDSARYWKVLPFKSTPAKSLEDWFRTLLPGSDPATENAIIGEWRDHPFDPHLIASNRPLAYMKHVVLAYVQNLVDWADMLFRQDSRESVNEALQLYVIASHILGPRPERVPRRGTIKAESYHSLESKWDDFSNALVELENAFPHSSDATVSDSAAPPNLLGIGPQFYFCIPSNDRLLKYWDTVADRLYKIRHCQNIDGVERKLALFAPPIDPGAIVNAMAQGLSLGSILAELSSPPPLYRFPFLMQKANEFCNDVKALGAALQAALEKKDAEELARLRATHEISLLEAMRSIKERQVLDAQVRRESIGKQRDAAVLRLHHYADLLGAEVQEPAPPSVAANLTADSPLPPDSVIAEIEAGVDVSLVDSDESGVKLIPKEKEEFDQTDTARNWQIAAQVHETIAAGVYIIPTASAVGTPLGVGVSASWGGTQLGNALSATGRTCDAISALHTHAASMAAKMSAYIRREQDWAFQANLAAQDIIQLDKQITSADIQLQVAQKELDNHVLQIEHSQAVEQFLAEKFTNTELYQWQKEQLFDVHKRSYNLAYELAKKAEKAYRFETGNELASFVQYGYWDDARQGLAAGERLQLALRQIESAYINDNRRELELSRSISLAELAPLALVELRERGKCRISIPEELFDRDFRGHYYRRIKAIRLSIPCVAGPYTPVSCSLRLLSNSVRINTALNSEGNYEHENDNGLWIDDDRFRTLYTPVTAIATSSGQSDSGLFEFSFNDERYLPFERAGAISEWELELSTEKDLRQFDQSRIADVILHMNYTARESGGLFKEKAAAYLASFLENASDLPAQPLAQMFSLKDAFPTEWHRFLHPPAGDQILRFVLGQQGFPFLAQNRTISVGEITVLARCSNAGAYELVFSYTDEDNNIVTSGEISLPAKDRFSGLKGATIGTTDHGLSLEELDISKEMTLKLRRSGTENFTSLAIQPKDEVTDIYLVVAYRLSDG